MPKSGFSEGREGLSAQNPGKNFKGNNLNKQVHKNLSMKKYLRSASELDIDIDFRLLR
ncbi:hypothetical protein [Rhodobacteraceae phage LS06-2018-MD06]|jgi:hypothetical protein|nr:hypothetical protein [Rhodobacteraceae phage LS06-2018-MD06]